MNQIAAYVTGAFVMFGLALWASFMPISPIYVLVMISVPHLFLGYVYGASFNKYILGMLLGLCAYMVLEFYMYGPVYKVTGLIYASGFILAVAMVLTARLVYNLWKPDSVNQ